MASPRQSRIYVLACVNGAGKSSIGGAAFRASGADYYNPDEAARALMAANPTLTQGDANSAAWHEGVKLLKRAIAERKDFAFETTLGANTIPRLLAQAASQSIEIYIWYVGFPVQSCISNESNLASAAVATTSPPSTSIGDSTTAGLTLSS